MKFYYQNLKTVADLDLYQVIGDYEMQRGDLNKALDIYRKILGKTSREFFGLSSLRTLNLSWKVGEILLLQDNNKAQGYFKKIKVDSKYYLKYIEMLVRYEKPYFEDYVQNFNPPFDVLPSYIWVFLLCNYYSIQPNIEISEEQLLFELS